MTELIKRSDAVKAMLGRMDGSDGDAKMSKALYDILSIKAEERTKLLSDGTLIVRVEDAQKVCRVLVEDANHWGGLYYMEGENHE